MILVDANILLYGEDGFSEHHHVAWKWRDKQLSSPDPVALCWRALTTFVRLVANVRLHKRPLTLRESIERVQSWLEQPSIRILTRTEQHWGLFQQMLRAGNATGNLVSDAHLAALAMEHNSILASTDADFARFRGLRWRNPIA